MYLHLSNGGLFPCLYTAVASSKPKGLGELKTVMQTRDTVKGLHNFREFSQPPKCFDEAIDTKKVLYC